MCVMAIATIASIGVGIAQAAAAQSAAMADYQNKLQYRKEQEVQNQKTLNQQVANMQAHAESNKDKVQGEMAEGSIATYAKVSTAQTMREESGASGGLSTAHLLGAIRGEGATFNSRLLYNAKADMYNNQNELKMAQRGAQARLAEIPIPVKPTNTFGLDALSAVASGLGQYAGYMARS